MPADFFSGDGTGGTEEDRRRLPRGDYLAEGVNALGDQVRGAACCFIYHDFEGAREFLYDSCRRHCRRSDFGGAACCFIYHDFRRRGCGFDFFGHGGRASGFFGGCSFDFFGQRGCGFFGGCGLDFFGHRGSGFFCIVGRAGRASSASLSGSAGGASVVR